MKKPIKTTVQVSMMIFCALAVAIFSSSCEKEQLIQEDPFSMSDTKAKSITGKENAFFPTFHQGFNHDLDPWVGNETPGFWGWCGSIELKDRMSADIPPSAGEGFATVMYGDCNEYWTSEYGETSGPATFDENLWSNSWPSSGFIHELDIYLDPDQYENGIAFIYANSLFYPEAAYPFIYFAINVEKQANALIVDGYPVSDAGWYTFRQVYDSDQGSSLSVNFELISKGKPLHTGSIEQTLGEVNTSDFDVNDLGSGYIWFVSIAEGVELPIDEYRLRPGR